MKETGLRNAAYGADKFGLKDLKEVHWNLVEAPLYEHAIRNGEATIVAGGALCAETGHHTGRSPKDKHTKVDALTENTVWWDGNRKQSQEHFDNMLADFQAHVKGKTLYAQDLYGGADPQYRIKARVFTEYAWHSLFIRNLLIRPDRSEIASYVPDMTIIDLPSFQADPARHGCRSKTVIAIDFARKLVLTLNATATLTDRRTGRALFTDRPLRAERQALLAVFRTLAPADVVPFLGTGLQTEEAVDLGLVEGLDDVDFVEDFPAGGHGLGEEVGGVVNDRLDFDLGLVGFELAAEHVDVFAPHNVAQNRALAIPVGESEIGGFGNGFTVIEKAAVNVVGKIIRHVGRHPAALRVAQFVFRCVDDIQHLRSFIQSGVDIPIGRMCVRRGGRHKFSWHAVGFDSRKIFINKKFIRNF